MDRQPVTPSGPLAGDGARIAGRAVIVSGIAIGLTFGLGWWVLAGWQADRLPVTEVALPQGGSSAQLLPFATPSGGSPSPVEATASVLPAPPVPSQPAPARPPAVTVAPPPPATRPPAVLTAVLTAHYATTSAWDTGYVANITITTAATAPLDYEVRLQLPPGVRVANAWSNSASSSSTGTSGTVTLRGGPVSAQRSVVVGFEATKPAAFANPRQFEPTSCAVNGNPCG